MQTPSRERSLQFKVPTSSLYSFHTVKQEHHAMCSPEAKSNAPIVPTLPISQVSPAPNRNAPATSVATDRHRTHKSNEDPRTQHRELHLGKRKKLDELLSCIDPLPAKRKTSSEFLRKGQWTMTEERLARLLIEAFEEGCLPIYTGIRLRGYLAVQLQCDPMRVSKKLCAGTIDGKHVPKNYGQKKFKLRKKLDADSDHADARLAELERLTNALWLEARMRKPAFLTLSSTRNLNETHGIDEYDSSPPSPSTSRSPSSTLKPKKKKVFPVIYLNLSNLKRYPDRDESYSSEPASPCDDSESDSEPIRLDGESLQAAYNLLTLCSPRGSSNNGKRNTRHVNKRMAKKALPAAEMKLGKADVRGDK
ncbi:hypothetical protein PsorP6_017658 [Peronosclerospora sorghi]|uniref:Uncharacterized protein n=1 Tax=Peronosclerospora sorghi TaxID=230839 RepID=A0ACC0WMV1_9STRA|nr:hypothetical protein PsorP6_017658 [Peronosclerospora sorghi]